MSDVFQQHGAFSWCELLTTDAAAAETFYSQVCGWTFEDGSVPDMPYKMIKVGDQQVGGIMPIPPNAQGMPPAWGLYVTVDDIDASIKLVEELGGSVVMPPMEVPDVGRMSVVQDPQGARFSIITYGK